MPATLTNIERAAEVASPPTPPESEVELNHILSKADMTKTVPIKAFCGTELEPWSGVLLRHPAAGRDVCIVCFNLWQGGMR
jgi:hypothetical protein